MEDFEDIQLEDTKSDMDPTGIHSDRGKGTGEDEDRMEFHNLVSALQDLAKGTPLSPVDRGSTSSNGKHAYTNMQNTSHIYNRPSSRPTMPQFLADAIAGPV